MFPTKQGKVKKVVNKTVRYTAGGMTDCTDDQEERGDYASWNYDISEETNEGLTFFEGNIYINARSIDEYIEQLELVITSMKSIKTLDDAKTITA